MSRIIEGISLAFDDVLLLPDYSKIKRGEANLKPTPFRHISPRIPIISSPMSSVTEKKMINAMLELGGLGIHHRYCDVELILKLYDTIYPLSTGVRVGPTEDYDGGEIVDLVHGSRLPIAVGSIPSHKETIDKLIGYGHKFFCIDVANGTHENALKTIEYIREIVPDADIMSGSIATAGQAYNCKIAGANILRIGVGPGSVCTTRVITGVGKPLFQSIIDIYESLDEDRDDEIILVADGGMRNSGDIVKALAAGADYVILGGLLAGSDESPSEVYEDKWTMKFKRYWGMASEKALVEENGKDPNHLHVEGEETSVPYTGPVSKTVSRLLNGIKQAMFYVGAEDIRELRTCYFIQITGNGLVENMAHGVRNKK